ncbi:glucose/quinate/shikimate family membrane-bound PQQ-dependent dehydrogenase (plasmid) [Tistrella bauzanensis]|uniref:Glucose/quinate/shikimate family membrane-bound PQQ-dependent dehydrogenase n=1 Tax=Tistrella arctica TaxID=3133430 RepID=A0ABU9YLI6_9PROT
MPEIPTHRRSTLLVLTALVFLIIGLGLVAAGGWLAAHGGSWYYVAAGLGFLIVAWLLFRGHAAALWTYALLTLASLVWAVGEVGLDWWQLAPRGDVIVVLGLWLAMPWTTRRLGVRALAPRALPLPLALAATIVVAVIAMAVPSHGIDGRLPMQAVADVPPDSGGVPAGDWHAYGRTQGGQRYSPLDQITPQTIDRLEVAWTYHTGDVRKPTDPNETTYQVTPLKVGDTLYLCTPHNYVIALDAVTGRERWRYDPAVPDSANRQHLTCRGVSYHLGDAADPATPPDQQAPCVARIFMPTADARLIALDARTGDVCRDFGENGAIQLWRGMPNLKEGFYYSTSPPVVTRELIVIGGAVNDNVSTSDPSGVIRAYDIDNGALVWNFDTGNPDATQPIEDGRTYTENSPNSWSIGSVDEALGLVYLPIGNQPPDQWGGRRSDSVERFSSSVTALDLATGQVRWVFQAVHHDLWDRDVPAQPTLIDLSMPNNPRARPDGTVPALVQPTKQGDIFVLDRRTGDPLLPVTEEPAPQGAAEGDHTAPTQPASALSFRPPPLQERDMWGATMFDQLACRIRYRSLDYDGAYTPPSVRGTLVYPGNFGVFNWGGVAVDPERQVVFATPAYLAFVIRLIPRDNDTETYVSDGPPGLNENFGAPFAVDIGPMLSPLGLPCQAPPWGYVAGADLRTGDIAWMRRNGTVRDRAPVPLPFEMGVPDLGGPLITAGGTAFISGTIDNYVRGYDLETGRKLWEDRLPAGGQATPMSYLGRDGRQYLLVVAGGHGSLGTDAGDAVIAYTLPENLALPDSEASPNG